MTKRWRERRKGGEVKRRKTESRRWRIGEGREGNNQAGGNYEREGQKEGEGKKRGGRDKKYIKGKEDVDKSK